MMGSVTGTGGACVAVRETHAAVVFLVGDRAYKMKKPVDLGFLDFTAEPARRAACHREVVLNRRLAPDVYLGVSEVTGLPGEPAEPLVVMRRMVTLAPANGPDDRDPPAKPSRLVRDPVTATAGYDPGPGRSGTR